MRLLSPLLAFVSLSLLVSCGFTDSGSGSETIRLNLMVNYKFGGSNLSLCKASVNTPGGLPVEDAIITLHLSDDAEPLVTLIQDEDEAGSYEGSFADYHQNLVVKLTSSQDGNLEAALSGPTRHVIASPLHSSTIERSDIGDGLRVTWNSEHGLRADDVVLRVPEKTDGFGDDDDEIEDYVYQSGSMDDTGSGTIPIDRLAETESIQVLRRNTVELSGGYSGSLFGISYLVENNIQLTN